jgi:polyhydroxybutyrate depolymerase
MEASGLTGFAETAENHGFIVAFPDGIDGMWNTFPEDFERPRDRPGTGDFMDDVAFTTALIDALATYLNIDQRRVYATGASNGGMMCYWLAMKAPHRFAALAPVMSTMPAINLDEAPPAKPMPIFILHGTADPVLPYEGGRFLSLPDPPVAWVLRNESPRMLFLSAMETVTYWAEHNMVNPEPIQIDLPDVDVEDGATASLWVYSGGAAGSDVVFCRVDEGGHTWPGGPQYLPANMIGNTCQDFDAAEIIWSFFERHTAGDD